uniref:Uncharacterized protein n=1 Tax=Poecilia formosa TaxID=48698 RepID=A0A087YR47_POEFO
QSNGDGKQEAVDVQDEDGDEHVDKGSKKIQKQFTGRPQKCRRPDQAAVQEGEEGQG